MRGNLINCNGCGERIEAEDALYMRGMVLCKKCITCDLCNETSEKGLDIIFDFEKKDVLKLCHPCNIGYLEKAEREAVENSLEKELNKKLEYARKNYILKPHELVKQLNKYVVGQEQAKKDISVAIFNHKKKLDTGNYNNKTNVMVIGPTGCGKTHIIKNACRISKLPFIVIDATTLTQDGYVGKNCTEALQELLKEADNDLTLAQKGVIYIDEVDKLKTEKHNGNKDISGESVQQSLLKMVEGEKITVDTGQGMHKHEIQIDTKQILFIFSGAFVGLKDIVKKRSKYETSIGFGAKVEKEEFKAEDFKKHLTTEDLISYGMIPEFIGRIPLMTIIDKLTEEQLIEILATTKESIIEEYQELFQLDKIKLNFTKKSLELIAKESLKRDTGARGLNSIIEKIMVNIVYHVQEYGCKNNKISITMKNIKDVL